MVDEIGEISGVGESTVEKLEKAGIESLAHASAASAETMAEAGVAKTRIKKIKNHVGNGLSIQTGVEAKEAEEKRKNIPTGIDGLDTILGGGWEQGFVTTIYGSEGTGKSQIAFQSLVSAVEHTGNMGIYIETEPNRYRSERLQEMENEDGAHEKVALMKSRGIEEQEKAYNTARLHSEELSLVVVDSFNAEFRGQFPDRSDFSNRATVMKHHMDDVYRLAEERNVPVLLTGQVYGNPQQYTSTKEVAYGGSVLKHSSGSLIHLTDDADLTKLTIEKHPGIGQQSVTIEVTDDGINSV